MFDVCDGAVDDLKRLQKLHDPDKNTLTRMSHVSADIEDVICYMNDIYTIGAYLTLFRLSVHFSLFCCGRI